MNRLMVSRYPNGMYCIIWNEGQLWCDDNEQVKAALREIIGLYLAADKYRFVIG